MKALLPRLGDKCQISACASRLGGSARQFRRNKAAYTTQPFSSDSIFINKKFNQASFRGTLSHGHATSGRHAPTSRPFPANNTRNAGKGRASYSAEATVADKPTIHDLFETKTGTWQYVVADPSTLMAVIIDPVLDYDPATQVVSTHTPDSLISLVREKGYMVGSILETHVHADHLTAASYLQNRLAQVQGYRPLIGIGKRIEQVQKLFGQRYGIPAEEYEGTFGKLFDDDETFNIGNLRAMAIHLPGHTPDHLGYKIGDNVFCGDSLFHADIGTARCDFPGGSANNLFGSARKLLGTRCPGTLDERRRSQGAEQASEGQHHRGGVCGAPAGARLKISRAEIAPPRFAGEYPGRKAA
ncbi:hypothetical protein V502_01971 [Pseudogymnoascus sp. VKM F-4520 (FW-2644)]|nr:hypothetical protein V502_01971 [Pseudogymnoascus sp. VKM F-4520 (FW-2644)]